MLSQERQYLLPTIAFFKKCDSRNLARKIPRILKTPSPKNITPVEELNL
jgi:hypothetical protein